jgi:hypothetical protein
MGAMVDGVGRMEGDESWGDWINKAETSGERMRDRDRDG